MKLTRPQIYVLIAILTVTIGLVTNVASNQLPERLKPYLWLSWPLLVVLAIVLLILTRKSELKTDDAPAVEFNLKHYYDALGKRFRTLDLDALTPPQKEEHLQLQLRSVFVEQSVRENPPPIELPKEILEKLQIEGELKVDDLPEGVSIESLRASGDQYYSNPVIPVVDVLTNSRTPHAVILGDPGSGKSTLARYIMLSLVDSDGDYRLRTVFEDSLPILIELRTYNALREEGKCDTFLEFLEFLGKTEGWNLTRSVLQERLTTKGAIVIFDGLDEVFEPGDRERVSHAIVGFAHTYAKAGIIVTSRIIGYQRTILTNAGFDHYTLQDLDRYQVESFVTRWYDLALSDRPDDARRRKERILQSFDQSGSVRQLAGNPMLLTIMAIIGKHQELPRERWKLYGHAVSVLIEHWDVKRHLDSTNVEAPFIGEEEKNELLRRLAHRMQGADAGLKGNYIHREQLQKEFHDYLVERFKQSPDRATTIARIMIDQFRQRNFILSLYGASVYGFVHRAFLEYFCATAFTYKFEKAHEITIEELADKVFGTHWNDESWHEVLRLICGILDERFAGKLIVYLLTIHTSKNVPDQTLASVELALRCLGEVRNLNSIVEAADSAMDVVMPILTNVPSEASSKIIQQISTVIEAAQAIGSNWPNRSRLAVLLRNFEAQDSAWIYGRVFGEFVSSVGADLAEVRDELIAYSKGDDKNRRSIWPYALAAGWRNDAVTLELIKRQMFSDPAHRCRLNATRAYVSFYDRDPEAVSLLCKLLQSDTDGAVRYEAIRYLYLRHESHPSLTSVFEAHLSDDNSLVRSTAFRALRESGKLTFSLLLDQISKERNAWNRYTLIDELANTHGNRPETRELLLRTAVAEGQEASWVRAHILALIARSYPNDPETWQFLQNRLNDQDNAVKEAAEQLIKAHEVNAVTPV